MDNNTGGKPQEIVKFSHPLGVTFCKIVIDSYNMHTAPGKCIQIDRQGGYQGFTFTGLHLCNLPLMKHYAANKLHIVMTHVQNTLSCLPHNGKCLGEQGVKGLSVFNALFKLRGLCLELIIRQCLDFRLKVIYFGNKGP